MREKMRSQDVGLPGKCQVTVFKMFSNFYFIQLWRRNGFRIQLVQKHFSVSSWGCVQLHITQTKAAFRFVSTLIQTKTRHFQIKMVQNKTP